MKPFIWPITLQIIGILVMIAEIFIPSLGLLTVISLGLIFYSLFIVFSQISSFAGMVLLGVDIIFIPILIIVGLKLMAKSPLALKKQLSSQSGVVSQKEAIETLLKKEGKAVTDLRPAGIALINDERMDVVTDGEYIDAGMPVVVTDVSGNRIVVEHSIDNN